MGEVGAAVDGDGDDDGDGDGVVEGLGLNEPAGQSSVINVSSSP